MSLHGVGAGGSKLAKAFSTHPTLERRLAELDKIQQQLGGVSGTGLEK
jgi:Zn-dependent protease with chaperone function